MIAIYAAIVSTALLFWEIISWWLGQARIEVQVYKAVVAGIPNDKPKICIQAINHGDKDITLCLFALKHKDKGFIVFEENISKLEARNFHAVYREEEYLHDALNPYVAIVRDATGRKYTSKPTKID